MHKKYFVVGFKRVRNWGGAPFPLPSVSLSRLSKPSCLNKVQCCCRPSSSSAPFQPHSTGHDRVGCHSFQPVSPVIVNKLSAVQSHALHDCMKQQPLLLRIAQRKTAETSGNVRQLICLCQARTVHSFHLTFFF